MMLALGAMGLMLTQLLEVVGRRIKGHLEAVVGEKHLGLPYPGTSSRKLHPLHSLLVLGALRLQHLEMGGSPPPQDGKVVLHLQ